MSVRALSIGGLLIATAGICAVAAHPRGSR
jgi:hypothetical protein